MEQERIKQQVQKRIVTLSAIILIGKFIAFYTTNSVGILTDAMESIVNVVAGVISLISLQIAGKPKDKQHLFGHGKFESLSASLEGLMIIAAGGMIIYEGVRRLFDPSMPEKLDIGIAVVAVAGIMNYAMGWYSIHIGKRYNSIALVAGGKHLQSDAYSTIGLLLGLVLLYFTQLAWIDGALALVFGTIIVVTGVHILRNTISNLTDRTDDALLQTILEAIETNRQDDWVDIHNLKAIKYGSYYHVDCDLRLPWYYNIPQGHDACELLNQVISAQFDNHVVMSIHSDSCAEKHCEHCAMKTCTYRKQPFIALRPLTVTDLIESGKERNLREGC